MNSRFDIWNILHDGEITVAAHEGTILTVFVNIPYLRMRIPPLGDSFSLRLSGVRTFEFSDYDENVKTSFLAEIAMNGIEILSTDSTSMPVKVATTQGFLTLDFDDLEIRLDTGQPIGIQTIEAACREYWDEWETKAKKDQK